MDLELCARCCPSDECIRWYIDGTGSVSVGCRSVSVGVGRCLGLRAAPAARLARKVGSNVGEVGARH